MDRQAWIIKAGAFGLTLACLAGLIGLGLWLRWPATDVNFIGNQDIAGITYNADLIRRGMVPLVDSLEYKAPGSFFITWWAWKTWGRSIQAMECFGIAWAILAGLGVFMAGRILFGVTAGMVAGLIYTLYAPIMDGISVNYNTWMITPYIWSMVFFAGGIKRGHWGWFVGCGVMIAWSGLCKRQGAVIFPLYLVVLWLIPRLSLPALWTKPHRSRAAVAYLAGIALGFVPIGLYYLVKGNLWTFIHHFFLSPSGWRYVDGELDWGTKLDRLEDAFLGFWEYLLLPILLAIMALVSAPLPRTRGRTLIGLLLGGHLLLSFLGMSLGFRFFRGYYLQVLPAAAWLAGDPDGPLLRWFTRAAWPAGLLPRVRNAFLILLVCSLVPLAGMADIKQIVSTRQSRQTRSIVHVEAERIAQIIARHTSPEQRIWVWGRWAWPVYYHAQRLSVTRYYKVLGVVTSNLTNTWRRPTSMTRFLPIGPYQEIGQQLTKGRPAFIVISNNEDYQGYEALEQLLKNDYRLFPDTFFSCFHLYQLKGLVTK